MNLLAIPPSLLQGMSQSDPGGHSTHWSPFNQTGGAHFIHSNCCWTLSREDHFWRLQSASLFTNVKLALLFCNSNCFLWPSDRPWRAHDVTHQNCYIMSQTELTVSWVITLNEIYFSISVCLTVYLCAVYMKLKGYSELINQLSILPSSKLSWLLMIGGAILLPLWTKCSWTWKRCRCLSSSETMAVCFFTDHRIRFKCIVQR